jgi:6-pyruvoyltetrahydropterin/6-carboxytetrahydropterin synthase
MSNKVAVFRKEHFNAAHRLYNPAWDEETNNSVFGKCALPNYHGHNYEMEVKVAGVPDIQTGYVMDMKLLSDLIKREIHSRFDHKNLNLDTEEFKNLNPTAENIGKELDLQVRLYETPRNFVEYPV